MGFFSFFNKKKENEEEKQLKILESKGIDPTAPLIENEFICNACGKEIENKPRFRNHNGRRMVFHKGCWKRLMNGNLSMAK